MPKLKGNISIRTTAKAGELLDQYLAEHPGMTETQVTAEALAEFIESKRKEQEQKSKGEA